AAALQPQPDPSSQVLWSCSFESSPLDCGFNEQSKVPGRAVIVGTARDGRYGVRLHTEPGGTNVVNSGDMERDDLWLSQDQNDGYEGHEAWWAHSILFPTDFAAPDWQGYVVFNFHNTALGAWQANFHVAIEPQYGQPDSSPGSMELLAYGGVNNGDG